MDFGFPAWVLLEIAVQSAAALETSTGYTDSWLVQYRKLAEQKGYLTSATFIAARQLTHDLKSAYGTAFLDQAGCDYPTQRQEAWPALMVRPNSQKSFAPVKHILLQTFLSNCDNNPKTVSYEKGGKKPRDSAILDAELSKAVEAGLRKWRSSLHRLTLAEFMSRCGCWSQYRHARKSLPSTARLVEHFKAASRQKPA